MNRIKVIGIMLIVLLTACSQHDESQEEEKEKQPAFINVYVYAPEQPMVTRADIGEVPSIDNTINEKTITSLQIWVFNAESEEHENIAYFSPESVYNLNNGTGATYQLGVNDAFSQAEPKPLVDVYVVANAASCGLALDKNTTRAQLEEAMIQIQKVEAVTKDYFGLTTLTNKVPEAGLPMSGVLRGVEVTGAAPVFKIIPTVNLMRAVSKLRFIFSNGTDKTIKITSIKLDEEMIPTQEYLFLESGENAPAYHLGVNQVTGEIEYVTGETEFVNDALKEALNDIAKNEDPIDYVYQSGQDAKEYEELIADGVDKGELTQVGPYYLRESNKRLTGKITYDVMNGETLEKEAVFKMAEAGDFSRNHTWIVYAYYGVSRLEVVTVAVQEWIDTTLPPYSVYNW